MLIINGRLSFKNDTDLHLKSKHIFIRAGELVVGYKEKPFANKATITLFGLVADKSMVFDNAIEAGNKVLSNVGNITMWGTPRKQLVTRLFAPANKGATTIKVDLGLDWVLDDRIALLATSYTHDANEDVII